MSSFLSKPSFKYFSHNHSTPKTQFFNSNSFSFFKKKKKSWTSSFSVSSQQQSQTPEPFNPQCNKTPQKYPFLIIVPYLVQCIRDRAQTCLEKWGSWFKGFSESNNVLEEQSLDFYTNGGKHLEFLQSGGIGMTLLSLTSSVKVQISPFITTLAANRTFVSGMCAWFTAQFMKVVLNFFVERKWDFRLLCASGGMPSSHTALCTSLTTAVALCHGVADSLFPVCLGFSLIVMYDAIGVRRHAGMQAEVLNMIIADLFQGHPISQRKLKELLGHTHSQVLAGAFLGILVACVCCRGSLVPAQVAPTGI